MKEDSSLTYTSKHTAGSWQWLNRDWVEGTKTKHSVYRWREYRLLREISPDSLWPASPRRQCDQMGRSQKSMTFFAKNCRCIHLNKQRTVLKPQRSYPVVEDRGREQRCLKASLAEMIKATNTKRQVQSHSADLTRDSWMCEKWSRPEQSGRAAKCDNRRVLNGQAKRRMEMRTERRTDRRPEERKRGTRR